MSKISRTYTEPFGWPAIFLVVAAMAFAASSAFAAKGGNGGGGGGSTPSVSVNGKVTNQLTGTGVAAATLKYNSASGTYITTTDATGSYSFKSIPADIYSVLVTATNFNNGTLSGVNLQKGGPSKVVNVVLTPTAKVAVSASVTSGAPETSVQGTGSCIPLDGSTVQSVHWSQTEGVTANIASPNSGTTNIMLGGLSNYKTHLIQALEEPPISADQLPPNVELQPILEVRKGLQDRFQVVGINHFALERGTDTSFKFACITTSGTYSASAAVAATVPWVVNPGLRNVPARVPVLLQAKCGEDADLVCQDQTTFNWSMTKPTGSNATLQDAATRNPWFTPDLPGVYEVTENISSTTLPIYAGTWQGAIYPYGTLINTLQYGGNGDPVADMTCTGGCHTGSLDKFTTWVATGHAEIFSQNLDSGSGGHYGTSCFGCHTVGFNTDPGAVNGGFDDQPGYRLPDGNGGFSFPFLESGLLNSTTHAWYDMLSYINSNDPTETFIGSLTRYSNAQCENCHGPNNDTGLHPNFNLTEEERDARVSLAPEVCASCHGEPARHGRYQQWELSSHADYDLAEERGLSNDCGRCHSGNGFVDWSEHNFDPNYRYPVSQDNPLPWDADTVQPQVCAACHGPHDTGNISGIPSNAKVRVNAGGTGGCGSTDCDTYTLIAGFVATDVGKAATCMTCHNSRAGAPHTDANWSNLTTSQKTGGPHHGVQADLIMGQNAYYMTANELVRGKHSLIPNVCVTCHMEKTPPPAALSYNQTGTNHTFAADPNICSDCHGSGVTADNINTIIVGYLDSLRAELGAAWARLLTGHTVKSNTCGGISGGTVADVEWVYLRGTRLNITLDDFSTCSNENPSSLTVDASQSAQTLGLETDTGAVYKAAWNYGLLYEDSAVGLGDRGVHNPDFSIKALSRAITAVQAVP